MDAVVIADRALATEAAPSWTRSFGAPKHLPGGFTLYLKTAAPGASAVAGPR
jgi:hypothetical protein